MDLKTLAGAMISHQADLKKAYQEIERLQAGGKAAIRMDDDQQDDPCRDLPGKTLRAILQLYSSNRAYISKGKKIESRKAEVQRRILQNNWIDDFIDRFGIIQP